MIKKIIKKKHSGKTLVLLQFYIALSTLLLTAIAISFFAINTTNQRIEDELMAATLASMTINTDRFATTGEKLIDDPIHCFNSFKKVFAYNEQIIETPGERLTFSGTEKHAYYDFSNGKKIKINQFIIYNVLNNNTGHTLTLTPSGTFVRDDFDLNINPVYSPDGDEIKKTSIFVSLEMPYRIGIFNMYNYINKNQLVAIESTI